MAQLKTARSTVRLPQDQTVVATTGETTTGARAGMAKYPFLSDEWVAQARLIYAETDAAGELTAASGPTPVRVNLVVTEVPFSGSAIDAHVDTSAGRMAIDRGHLDAPDVTVSLDYATARSLFVGGDVQAVMQAFLTGRIKVDGDLTKLLDARSAIWPVSGPRMPDGPGQQATAGAPTVPGAPSTVASGWQGPGLGFASAQAAQVAARLQEITE